MVRGAWGRDPLLPRAFSLMGVGPGGTADILAKTVGRGTALLEKGLPGADLDILGPAGDELPSPRPDTTDLLVAGGVGLPPLYMQGRLAAEQRAVERTEMIYGGRGAPDLVLLAEMEAMRLALFLTTEDGSVGTQGLVTRALEARLERHRGTGPRDGVRSQRHALGGGAARQGAACPASFPWRSRWPAASGSASAAPFRPARAPSDTFASNGPVFDAADVLDVVPEGKPPGAAAPAECPS